MPHQQPATAAAAPAARHLLRAAASALAALLLLLVVAAAPSAAATTAAEPSRVLLVGAAGLRWSDVTPETTPVLHELGQRAAIASVSTRSVRALVCPADGWLAVSAGRRAADAARHPRGPFCRTLEPPREVGGAAVVTRWPAYLQAQACTGADYGARLGLLGQTLRGAGVPATAVGPGAAVALADGDGRVVGAYAPTGGVPAAVGAPVAAAFARGSRLVVVDAGQLRDPAELPEPEPQDGAAPPEPQGRPECRPPAAEAGEEDPALGGPPRAVAAAELDARIGAAVAAAPPGTSVLVASLADSGPVQHLTLLAATGPAPQGREYARSLLWASSTRQDGIVQATDVLPTLLALLDLGQPAAAVGSPFGPLAASPTTARGRLEAVLDTDAANQGVRAVVGPFFSSLVVAQLLLYGGATLVLRTRSTPPARRRRVLATLQRVAVLFACVPVATFLANLVPWWRSPASSALLVLLVLALSAGVAALALAPPWGRRPLAPFGLVAGLTAAVLALDVVTGSRLGTSSLMGVQPIVAGRFYGFGNTQFALFATGTLLAATAAADALLRSGRRRSSASAAAVVAVLAVAAVVVDGTPGWGSDFGGPPAIIPAMALLGLAAAGVRVTPHRLVAIGVGTAVVVTALAVGDFLRPPGERTHLGRFVQTVLDGGGGAVVERKIRANLRLLLIPLNLIVPFAAAFVALVLLRPAAWGAPALHLAYARMPLLRPGLVSLLVLLGIGTVMNDSGVSIIAVGATLAVPLVTALSARVLELELAGAAPGTASPAVSAASR